MIIVRKVRNKNAIHPVRLSKVQYDLVMKLGIPIELYVKEQLKEIAKRRRWTWWFEKEKQNASD